MSPKYSFVLPAYKAAFFREAIDSILAQSYTDFELIIVNDASPEDLTSIVNSYHDERIQYYINEQNIGGRDLVAQWNHCITYAKGDYLILASDDDIYHPEYLGKMDVLVDKYPEVNVFRPRVQYIHLDGNVYVQDESQSEYLDIVDFLDQWNKHKLLRGIPFYIFNYSRLVDNGGVISFPSAWFSDDATVIKLARDGVVIHNEVLFSFRNSGINISSTRNTFSLLYKKLLATESFYLWLAREFRGGDKAFEKDKLLSSILSDIFVKKLNIMTGAICGSRRVVVLLSWYVLLKIKTLSFSDRFKICIDVFRRKILKMNN